MWVNKELFQQILEDNRAQQHQLTVADVRTANAERELRLHQDQKTKDDVTIDWMRHRINALEKERTVLLMKAAGIALPTPEIQVSGPREVAMPKYDYLPSFDDMGDEEAARLGLSHDEAGQVRDKEGNLISATTSV